jgi:hypothetical protein
VDIGLASDALKRTAYCQKGRIKLSVSDLGSTRRKKLMSKKLEKRETSVLRQFNPGMGSNIRIFGYSNIFEYQMGRIFAIRPREKIRISIRIFEYQNQIFEYQISVFCIPKMLKKR